MKSQITIKRFPLSPKQKATISTEIDTIYQNCFASLYLDACVKWANDNDVDIEDIPKCINNTLYEKMHKEAIDVKFIKSENSSTAASLDSLM